MTHPRKLIRKAIRDRLGVAREDGTFPTMAGESVFASRIANVTDDEYPAILIYTREEGKYSEPVDDSLLWRKATLSVVIEGLVRAGETVDDKLDDLAEQVEDALDGWTIPGFESANLTLTGTDIDLVTENVRRPIGAVGLSFDVTYRVKRLVELPGPKIDTVDSILWGDPPAPPNRIVSKDKHKGPGRPIW